MRRLRTLELRVKGTSREKILETIEEEFVGFLPKNYALRTVSSDINVELRKIARTRTERAEEARTLDLERLDRLIEMIWPIALSGELKAVDRILRILERRAALLGIDTPKGHTLDGQILVRFVSEWRDNPSSTPPWAAGGALESSTDESGLSRPALAQDNDGNGGHASGTREGSIVEGTARWLADSVGSTDVRSVSDRLGRDEESAEEPGDIQPEPDGGQLPRRAGESDFPEPG